MGKSLTHTMIAVFMMICIGLPLSIMGVSNDQWIAAAFAISFYYGREVSQFQTALANKKGVTRSSLWYRGWFPGEWPTWAQRLEFIIPAIVCVLVALMMDA